MSISADPLFYAWDNPMPRNVALRGAGTYVDVLYAYDLYGRQRSSTTDIGAVNIALPQIDQAVLAIKQLGRCGDSAVYFRVTAQNHGEVADTLRVRLVDSATGGSWTGQSQDKVEFLKTDTFLVGPINTYAGATLKLTGFPITPGDENHENDTLRGEFSFIHYPLPPEPVVRTICPATSVSIDVPDSFSLYSSLSASKPLVEGPGVHKIPFLSRDTTLYMAKGPVFRYRVKPEPYTGITTGINNTFMNFETSEAIRFDSFKIYVTLFSLNPGTIEINLRSGPTIIKNIKKHIPLLYRGL